VHEFLSGGLVCNFMLQIEFCFIGMTKLQYSSTPNSVTFPCRVSVEGNNAEFQKLFVFTDEKQHYLGILLLIAVVIKNSVFLDIMLCIPVKGNPCFGGTCHLHIQGRRISQ
jgi:hypothetical protein